MTLDKIAKTIGVSRESLHTWKREGCPVSSRDVVAITAWRAEHKKPRSFERTMLVCQCANCAKSFESYSKPRKFCSSECRSENSETVFTCSCAECGKQIRVARQNRDTFTYALCSDECRQKRRGYCKHCSNPLPPTTVRDSQFCSKHCKATAAWINKQLGQILHGDRPYNGWPDRCLMAVNCLRLRRQSSIDNCCTYEKDFHTWRGRCLDAMRNMSRLLWTPNQWKEKCKQTRNGLRFRPLSS